MYYDTYCSIILSEQNHRHLHGKNTTGKERKKNTCETETHTQIIF